MSRAETGRTLRAAVAEVAALAGSPEVAAAVDGRTVQDLLATATALYASKRLSGEPLPAFEPRDGVQMPTATDVAVTVTAMLDSAHIEVFELGLWQTWGMGTATRGERDD